MRQLPSSAPRRVATPTASPFGNRRTLLLIVAALLVLWLARGVFGHHANKYETIAHDMTLALQHNDLAGVQKFQNAETATRVTRARVGHAADVLAPLGGLKSVKETSSDAQTREHDFLLTFERGQVNEKMRLDPADKVIAFGYDLVAPGK